MMRAALVGAILLVGGRILVPAAGLAALAGGGQPLPGQLIVLDDDWTKRPPAPGKRWTVKLNDTRSVEVLLLPARSCGNADFQSYDLQGPEGMWGRLYITPTTVRAFLEEDPQQRLWLIKPAGDGPRTLRVIDAREELKGPAGHGCRLLDAQVPPGSPFLALINGAAKQMTWPAAPHIFDLSLSMTPDVKVMSATIEMDLLTTADFASAVFERHTGISFCSAVRTSETTLSKDLDATERANAAQTAFSSDAAGSTHDIGVLFFRGSDSGAALGSACDPKKNAMTVVDYNSDYKDTWRLAHELAHQFGATHTFENTLAEREPTSAVEPGVGASELGNPDLPEGYWFHPLTAAQLLIGRDLTVKKFKCGRAIPTAPSASPVVSVQDLDVPPRTPFRLAPDIQPVPNPAWLIAMDDATLDVTKGLPGPPFFRSRPPSADVWRSFPFERTLMSGSAAPDDAALEAGSARVLVMARDERGNVGIAVNSIRVRGKDPFEVATPKNWVAGRVNELTWNPGASAGDPFNVAEVTVSVFDGKNWGPGKKVQNSGKAGICLLATDTGSEVRVRLEPSGHPFFAMTPAFIVAAPSPGPHCKP
jgi:hypothetical protein